MKVVIFVNLQHPTLQGLVVPFRRRAKEREQHR